MCLWTRWRTSGRNWRWGTIRSLGVVGCILPVKLKLAQSNHDEGERRTVGVKSAGVAVGIHPFQLHKEIVLEESLGMKNSG